MTLYHYHAETQQDGLPLLRPPSSWKVPETHGSKVLSHPWYRHLFRIQHEVSRASLDFFTDRGLMMALMPVTTSSISSPMGKGSDSLPVEVELFGVKSFLADSMQFMLELSCRLSESGSFYVMPCFRGEASDEFHLAQFYHVEAEIPGSLKDVMKLAGGLVHHLTSHSHAHLADSITKMAGSMSHVEHVLSMNGIYPTISMRDAISELKSDPAWVTTHPEGFQALNRAGEQEIVRRFDNLPVWVTHFDPLSVPFYQATDPETKKALNADLLLGTCETVGAGQRHESAEAVKQALRLHDVSETPYQWYLEMRQHQPLMTSGFGMGLERYLLWLLQHSDIRDLTILYRENGLENVP